MNRANIDNKYKWNIEEIFKNDAEFYKSLENIKSQIDFSKFIGKLSDASILKEFLTKYYDLMGKIEVLSVYSMMKRDQDGSDSEATKMCDQLDNVYMIFSSQVSFYGPELNNLSVEELTNLKNNPLLKGYELDLDAVIREKPHILSQECEELLALSGKVLGGYHDIFSSIDNVDFKFPTIKVDGEDVKVTHGTYSVLLSNPNKEVRKEAYKAYYKEYGTVLNTIFQIYSGSLNKDVFVTRVRKFNSCLERALFGEEVSENVYKNLIDFTASSLTDIYDYISLRKKVLNLDEINMYDLYCPIVKDVDFKLDFEDSFDLVLKGLSCLGEDYINLLKTAKDNRWIDVYENDGKRSGAYSVCVYNLNHPYVLLNHTKNTHSVFTIAHELGHAIHSYKSKNAQPIQTADYKIFVAEVASTVNEMLLIKYLIKNAKNKDEKKYYLSYYIDTMRTTLYRQTMFAEFEYKVHSLVENDQPISKEIFNDIYRQLNIKYYGNEIVTDDEISTEWARIPHFYTSFYVYKYATGIISANAISEKILENPENVKNYFEFLSSGCSKDPVSLLKIAGVDLTTSEPFEICKQSIGRAIKELKELFGE